MLNDLSTDPEALRKSVDRATIVLNCYEWLLQAIPNPEESLAFAEKASLKELMNDMKGDWSLYSDYTVKIVPFETSFFNRRQFYASEGVDMSKVPYLVLQDNTMNPPVVLSDAEAKKRFTKEEASNQPPVTTPDISWTIIGAGALAVFTGYLILRPRKRRTIGRREVWRVGDQDYYDYDEAKWAYRKLRSQGLPAKIKHTAHYIT